MLNYIRSSVYSLTVPLILLSLFSNLSCKMAKNPILLPVDFTKARAGQLGDICRTHLFQRLLQQCCLYMGTRKMEKIIEFFV